MPGPLSKFFGSQIGDSQIGNNHIIDGSLELTKLARGSEIILNDGTVSMKADFDAGSNKLVNVGVGINAMDAVNVSQLDAMATGNKWRDPVLSIRHVGNVTVAALDAMSVGRGDSFLMTDSGTLTQGSFAVQAGDIIEWTGEEWVLLQAGVGGVPALGTRVVLAPANLVSPYIQNTDNGKILVFDGISMTGSDTGEAVEGIAVLVNDLNNLGYWDSIGFTLSGAVPTGIWRQFTGTGQVNAGLGLVKDGNTLYVGAGQGTRVDGDAVHVKVSDNVTSPMLSVSNAGLHLSDMTAGYILVGDATNRPVPVAMTGDVSIDATGATTIDAAFTRKSDWVIGEVPVGAIDGVNMDYSISAAAHDDVAIVTYQCQRMIEGIDYTLSGTDLTMLFAPESGASLIIDFQTAAP